jgi:hypothetical protein
LAYIEKINAFAYVRELPKPYGIITLYLNLIFLEYKPTEPLRSSSIFQSIHLRLNKNELEVRFKGAQKTAGNSNLVLQIKKSFKSDGIDKSAMIWEFISKPWNLVNDN